MAKMRLADPERNNGRREEGCSVSGGPFYAEARDFYHDVPYQRKQDLTPVVHAGFSRGVRWANEDLTDVLEHRPHSSKHNMILDTTRKKRPAKTTY